MSRSICDDFHRIHIKLITPTDTPDQCVDLMNYLDFSRLNEVFQLQVHLFKNSKKNSNLLKAQYLGSNICFGRLHNFLDRLWHSYP